MHACRRLAAMAATTAVTLSAVLVAGAATAAATAGDTTASELLTRLAVASETGSGYDRALFPHWVDADGDGCHTRQEVLIEESLVPAQLGSGCTVLSGQWTSWYDGATWSNPSDVDVDHFVPLAEAWASGASAWTSTQRRDFANDLGLPASLEAVTDEVNAAKSAGDPAEWLPPLAETHCRYAVAWVTVKFRWSLAVDTTERNRLGGLLSGACGTTVVTVPAVAVVAPTPAPTATNQLVAGATLAAGAQLTSPNARYRAVMQTDGNFVVYSATRALWSSRTYGNPGARLVMQTDGNLVVYSATNRPVFHTGTFGRGGERLVVQDDGNLVLYAAGNRAVWFTGADRPPPPATAPTGNTVSSGQTLAAGMTVSSANGRYRLTMQTDGNLVAYAPTRALWSSRTHNNPGARLVMQGDGNAVVYSKPGTALFHTRTPGNAGARLVIQDDGNLVVYAGIRPLWNTGPEVVALPPSTPPPTPPPTDPRAGCSPAYPDVCIPPPPPDLDCPEIPHRNIRVVIFPDPHGLDGNRDGIACQA